MQHSLTQEKQDEKSYGTWKMSHLTGLWLQPEPVGASHSGARLSKHHGF
jgi:hypothetical protein